MTKAEAVQLLTTTRNELIETQKTLEEAQDALEEAREDQESTQSRLRNERTRLQVVEAQFSGAEDEIAHLREVTKEVLLASVDKKTTITT